MIKYTAGKILTYVICLSLALTGCKVSSAEKKSGILKGYDLNKPQRFPMPSSLIEISGIAFNRGAPDPVYAIQDEEGKFYKITLGVKKQTHSKFGKHGDYEDVALLNGRVIVLKSNGVFYSFKLADANDEEIENVAEWKKLLPEGEYESLYADDATNLVYVVCKNCTQDKGSKNVSGFIFTMDSVLHPSGTFMIDVASHPGLSDQIQKGLRPSALAKNPLTQEWYILSSVNKLLLIADARWRVTQVVKLSSNTFNQPEGIAFDTHGNLYISNEGDDTEEGNILKFLRQP